MCRRLVFTYETNPDPDQFDFYIAEKDAGFERQMPLNLECTGVQIIRVAVQPPEPAPGFPTPHTEVLGRLVAFVSEAYHYQTMPTEFVFKGELKKWSEHFLALASFP